jgi:hypothetical protein
MEDGAMKMSRQLKLALEARLVVIDEEYRTATIAAPTRLDSFTDGQWLDILRVASKIGQELEALGYRVQY